MSTGPRTYTPQTLQTGSRIDLDSQSAAHLLRVLRMTDGDSLRLFNGDGHEYAAVLCDVQKKGAAAEVGELLRSDAELSPQMHLGQVVSKGRPHGLHHSESYRTGHQRDYAIVE